MCGISGFIDWSSRSDEKVLREMTDTLSHRGPDGAGYEVFSTEFFTLGMGHRRLAIIDLSSTGHQPMKYRHLWITFNGEIYNYKKIKKLLEEKGYHFKTYSDTEVILAGFMEWGKNVVLRLNGMFSFVIYDTAKRKCYCFRDRAGVKPFYYYRNDGLFIFGSELKALLKHPQFQKRIDHHAIGLFLQYGYISDPYTIYKNTYKLRPGFFLEIDCASNEFKEICYWNLFDHFNKEKVLASEEELLEQIEDLLISSFQYRLIADVKVGVFLSGGYDSAAVASILQSHTGNPLNTYTIGFNEGNFNEADYAKKVANYLGTNHTEYYCSIEEAKKIIPDLPYFYDEPFADSSAIPTMLVSRVASKYVKVILSADGGDELFAGYDKYAGLMSYLSRMNGYGRYTKKAIGASMTAAMPLVELTGKKRQRFSHNYQVMRNALLKDRFDPSYLLQYSSQHINSMKLNELLVQKYEMPVTVFDEYKSLSNKNDFLNELLAMDYRTYLPFDILTKVDRATMSASIEGRDPLLDYRLAEFMARIPGEMKYKNNRQKYLLKKIVHKYLPESMMNRPKKGFAIPVQSWFRNDLKDMFEDYLEEGSLSTQGIFHINHVRQLKRAYYSGNDEAFNILWHIFIFEMWYEKWYKN